MSDGLDVIVVDDDPGICEIVSELIESFYTWGNVVSFSNAEKAETIPFLHVYMLCANFA